MRLFYLLLLTTAAVACAVPASAQYMYLDVNGDGISTTDDFLTPSTTSIDVWLDTDSNKDGSTATCGGLPLTINSYTIALQATGGVTYGAWTDNMGFSTSLGGTQAGNDFWVGRGSSTAMDPGTYKLGTLAVTVAGSPVLSILATDPSLDPEAMTSFGSLCLGLNFDNTLRLGVDWFDVQGTYVPIPVTNTTWGKIKQIYIR